MSFERIDSKDVYEGKIAGVRVDRFRYDDGEQAEREIVTHPGAVAVLPLQGDRIHMVRQPREAVGAQGLLELPAGKLDEDGEEVLDTAKRELAEEIGKQAGSWRHIATFWSSPGFSDEQVHVYLATDLSDASAEAGEDERIEIVEVPLERLDQTIAECEDAKSLVGLMWLRAYGKDGP